MPEVQPSVQQEVGPAAYAAGGFDISGEREQVVHAIININDPNYLARVTGINNKNQITVQVYTIDFTAGAVAEVADGTDLTGINFTLVSYSQQ